ncbi:unnamed protein product, partial [Closterium sp. NIES-53]
VSVVVGEIERLQQAAQHMADRAAQEIGSLHAELAAATSALEQERSKHAATRHEAEERQGALREEQVGQARAVARIRRQMEERVAEHTRVTRCIQLHPHPPPHPTPISPSPSPCSPHAHGGRQDLEARHRLLTARLSAMQGATHARESSTTAGTAVPGPAAATTAASLHDARGAAAGSGAAGLGGEVQQGEDGGGEGEGQEGSRHVQGDAAVGDNVRDDGAERESETSGCEHEMLHELVS